MIKTRSSTKLEDSTNAKLAETKTETPIAVKMQDLPQYETTTTSSGLILPKKITKPKLVPIAPAPVNIAPLPQVQVEAITTEATLKRKAEEQSTTATAAAKPKKARATRVKKEAATKVKAEPPSAIIIDLPNNAVRTEPAESSSAAFVAATATATTAIKVEPKVKAPRARKATATPKAPRAKKEPKEKKPKVVKAPKAPKPKKKRTTLPVEADLYLSNSMKGRVHRAMKQRMFVMSRQLSTSDDSVEVFEVLGSVGNNYRVTIGPIIKCTCMDYAIRTTHCKHILMVLLKVYHAPCSSPLYQTLTTSRQTRLEARFTARVVDPSILVPNEIRQKILSLSHVNHPDAAAKPPVVEEDTNKRRPLDTSDCPICFEEFEEAKIDETEFCKTCGNNVHKECFQMWARSKGSNVTCVYCRSKWKFAPSGPSAAAGPSKRNVRELDQVHVNETYYANFAAELGISKKRDTSSYGRYGHYNFD